MSNVDVEAVLAVRGKWVACQPGWDPSEFGSMNVTGEGFLAKHGSTSEGRSA